jgi:hypothetical protein
MRAPSPTLRTAMVAGAIVLMAISGSMLWQIGYNYDGLQGSPLTKLHPFTYFIFAALAWRALQSGDAVGYVRAKSARRPAAAWLLALSVLLVVTAVLRAGPGAAGFVDTFGGPAVFALLLDDYDEADLRPLVIVLHAVMTANALMALFEFASSTLFFPYRLDGVAHLEDTRSTALQGHPLINAALTGVYVLSLMGGAKQIPAGLRALMILMQFAALVVFGGRTAIVVSLTLTPLFGVYYVFASLRRGRVSLLATAAVAAVVPLLALGVVVALASGLADPLLMRFVDDNGSAETRVIMFEMLRPFTLPELIVGPDIEQVESLRRHFGLEQGVENPFIRMTLYQGGFVMAVVFASLVWFFRELLRGRGLRVLGPVVAMAVLLNASESIATKTNFLDKLVLMFVCMFPVLSRARAPAVAPQLSPSAATTAQSSVRSRSSIKPMPSNRHQNAQGKPYRSALSRTSLI